MNIQAAPPGTVPLGIYPYFDKVQVWLKAPPRCEAIGKLRQKCGHLYVDNRSARFGQGFRQRLELKQPSDEALKWLLDHPDLMINRVEVALDFVFNDRNRQDDAFEFFHRHLIRRWHGKTQRIKLVRAARARHRGARPSPELVDEVENGQTRYDAGRAPNKIVFYKNPCSRITGELNCLHLEWHLNGLPAVQNVGIVAGEDLMTFDHRQFWQRRIMLVEIDAERLGRLMRNRVDGTKGRTKKAGRFANQIYRLDRRRGHVMLNAFQTMQELMDEYGSRLRLHRILSPIGSDVFLPASL